MAMIKQLLSLFLVIAMSACCTSMHSRVSDAAVLMRADEQFAAESASSGSPAWERWFATQSAERGNTGWTMGNKAVATNIAGLIGDGNKKGVGSLTWHPTDGRISKAGNIGTTWGRYTITTPRGVQQGTYLTVWEKQADGTWKVIFDAGDPDHPN